MRRHRAFLALFLALCLIPSLGLLVFGPAQPAANEVLPAPPAWTDEEGRPNAAYLNDLSDWLDRRFALRQELVTAEHRLMTAVFRTSPEEDVILGKDGWLFYGETLADYEGLGRMTDREVWCAARSLALMQERCAAQGARFLFTIAPNKNSLYGDRMPDRYPRGTGESSAEALAAALADQGVAYADLFTPLREAGAVLYRAQDSHWTQEGAGLAADVLRTTLGRDGTPWYGGATRTVREETGDLYAMLYPTGDERDEDVLYDRSFAYVYTSPFRSAEDNLIRTSCETGTGRLLMFRDSFGNALHPLLAEGYAAACFCRLTPYDLGLIETEGADTVIVELVERNLRWLLDRPAVLPAPERADVAATPAALGASYTVAPCEQLPGYVTVTGTYTAAADTTSPVLLRAGGAVYEATPTGEGRYTARLPEGAADHTLLLTSGGRWVAEHAALAAVPVE